MEPAENDRRYVWHPFTQMREWVASEPIVIVEAEGASLRDAEGRVYLDGNSSIWTNLHGHRRPELDRALNEQLGRVAHSSFLGLTNDVTPAYARELLQVFTDEPEPAGWRVFFSDDGSTAIEAGLKMMHQARQQRGEGHRTVCISLGNSYHGDTVGAMSLGQSSTFHGVYRGLMFPTREVVQPACYRCPCNRAEPVPGADARLTRQCQWECVGAVEQVLEELGETASAFVAEPRVQGAGSMAMQPEGYVDRVAALCRAAGVWLMLDEVLTGFGRTGPLFAGHSRGELRGLPAGGEGTPQADVVALGKGITGGYLPFAATIATQEIYDAFLGDYAEFRTFFHGHSYSGNQLGAAAARASLEVLRTTHTAEHRQVLAKQLESAAQQFWQHPNVGDIRCEGTICAIELVREFRTRARFRVEDRIGFKVCAAAQRHGLLTRNIGDVLVLMPPYCMTRAEIARAAEALWLALNEILPPPA